MLSPTGCRFQRRLKMNTMTNCPNCGAPFTGYKCEYCGTIAPENEKKLEDYRSAIEELKLELAQADQSVYLLAEMGHFVAAPSYPWQMASVSFRPARME